MDEQGGGEGVAGANDIGVSAKYQIYPPLSTLEHISHNNPVDHNQQ